MTRVRDSIFVALHRWFLPSSHVTTRAELCTPRKIANLWLFTVFVDVTTWKTNFNMFWVEFRWNTVSKNTHDINLVKLFQNKIKHTYLWKLANITSAWTIKEWVQRSHRVSEVWQNIVFDCVDCGGQQCRTVEPKVALPPRGSTQGTTRSPKDSGNLLWSMIRIRVAQLYVIWVDAI